MARLAAGVSKAVEPRPIPGDPRPIRNTGRIPARVNPPPRIESRVNNDILSPHINTNYPAAAGIQPTSPAGAAATFGASSAGGGGADFSAMSAGLTDPTLPVTPTIPSASADALYMQQKAALAQQLADKQAEDRLMRGQYDQNYGDSLRMMGWAGDPTTGSFDPNNQQGYYGQANTNVWNDYAGRGMLNSGAFGDALSQLASDYGQRKTGLDTARGQYLGGLTQDLQSYTNQNTSADADALMQAIARIAQQYQVDPSQVTR